jgi:uncharacterized membrane protein
VAHRWRPSGLHSVLPGSGAILMHSTTEFALPSQYREAALGSGANHFMTKGSVSITDIFGIIGSILASRLSTVACAESVPA